MLTKKYLIVPFIAATCVFSSSDDLAAQSSYRSKTYSKSIGNSYLGGSIYARARANFSRRSSQSASGGVEGYVSATARFFKRNASLASARGTSNITVAGRTATFRGSAYARLANKTVLNRSVTRSFTFPAVSQTFNLFPTDPRITVPVWGPIALTAKGNIGAGISFRTGTYFSSSAKSARVYASGRTWGHARGSVAFGVPKIVSAGVEVQGTVADQSLYANLTATPAAARLSGLARYTMRAVALKFSVFAKIITPVPTCWRVWKTACWRKTIRKTLASWTSPSRYTTLLRL